MSSLPWPAKCNTWQVSRCCSTCALQGLLFSETHWNHPEERRHSTSSASRVACARSWNPRVLAMATRRAVLSPGRGAEKARLRISSRDVMDGLYDDITLSITAAPGVEW